MEVEQDTREENEEQALFLLERLQELKAWQREQEEKLLQDIGRVRQVAQSPDGYIYAITEATGLLVKLLPIR